MRKYWRVITNTRANMFHYPGYFDSLCACFEGDFEESRKIILKDVRRTANCQKDPVHFDRVFRVLMSYAKRNPEIGYLQGFNFMVDYFLTQEFSTEETFWVLVFVIEDLLHKQFYASFFPMFADIKFFKYMLYHVDHKIFKFVAEEGLDLFFILHKWFLLHFMDISNRQLTRWFLDYFFVEREIATLKATIVFFTCRPKELMRTSNMNDLKKHFEETIESFVNERKFKSVYNKFYLSKELFEYARDLLIKKEESTVPCNQRRLFQQNQAQAQKRQMQVEVAILCEAARVAHTQRTRSEHPCRGHCF